MKPTDPELPNRRDGWFEHRGIWDEVRVGTILADPNSRTKRWEVLEMRHGGPVEYGMTLWFKIREMTSLETHVISPQAKLNSVTILTSSPLDTKAQDLGVHPSDSTAILHLIEQLGAEVLARQDTVTGEIVCPDYNFETHIEDGVRVGRLRGLIQHMRFAHTLSVDDNMDLVSAVSLHGTSHDPNRPEVGKVGFGHRHVPEDLTILSG